jgi:Protein of unknown function (DUF2795)
MEGAMASEGHVSAQLGRFLKGLNFPAGQHDLFASAKQNGADQGVLDALAKMPQRQYESIAEVMDFYRKME